MAKKLGNDEVLSHHFASMPPQFECIQFVAKFLEMIMCMVIPLLSLQD
jgi:hypothetical protein